VTTLTDDGYAFDDADSARPMCRARAQGVEPRDARLGLVNWALID